ncbi:MAG TPA: alanine racemase [Terriglobia bacterium]|nr:alanine racemase [Terriglobia bacterium]
MHFRELSTPALTIDLAIVERNLDRMARLCREQGVGLRPHTKTHKTPEVAQLQLDRGAVGLTVAKVGEAEVMAGAGLDEILIAYPVFGREKLERLAKLACDRKILISLDDEHSAQELSRAASGQGATVGVLVEFDAGFHRCGLQPGQSCVEVARKIEKLPGLKFRGLMTYFGNVWGSEEERKKEMKQVAEQVVRAMEVFDKARMPVEILSGGSTPSAPFAGQVPGLTEIRPGTYVYNDLNTFYQGACRLEDCAARVVTTVVSTAVPGRAIIDAGSKTLSSDALSAGSKAGYGCVVEAPEAPLIKLNEEHGHIEVANSSRRFHVGDVLTVVPNHVCTCVNMHDEAYLLRDELVVGCWRIAARGKIR